MAVARKKLLHQKESCKNNPSFATVCREMLVLSERRDTRNQFRETEAFCLHSQSFAEQNTGNRISQRNQRLGLKTLFLEQRADAISEI